MKRKLCLFLLVGALALSACAAAPASPSAYSFTDAVGNTVSVSKAPENVAVLFSSFAQIWTLAGGEVSVTVGESVQRGFAASDAKLVDAGAGKTIDHELLLAAQPDFVIGSADIEAHVDACRMAMQAGIPAALFRVDTFEDYLAMLKICTDLTGDLKAYEINGIAVAQQLEALKQTLREEKKETKNILFIRAGSQYSATKAKRAPDNFVCVMLDELGAHNIADEADVLLDTLSLEEILLHEPDYIFLTTMGDEDAAKAYIADLFSQEGWKDMKAVRAEQYTFLEKELFHFKPNHRWAEAYAILAQLLYPELRLS